MISLDKAYDDMMAQIERGFKTADALAELVISQKENKINDMRISTEIRDAAVEIDNFFDFAEKRMMILLKMEPLNSQQASLVERVKIRYELDRKHMENWRYQMLACDVLPSNDAALNKAAASVDKIINAANHVNPVDINTPLTNDETAAFFSAIGAVMRDHSLSLEQIIGDISKVHYRALVHIMNHSHGIRRAECDALYERACAQIFKRFP